MSGSPPKLVLRWGGLRFGVWPYNHFLFTAVGFAICLYIGVDLAPNHMAAVGGGIGAGVVLNYLVAVDNEFLKLSTSDKARFLALTLAGTLVGTLLAALAFKR